MSQKYAFFFLLISVVFIIPLATHAQQIAIVTEEYPPYNFFDSDLKQINGLSTEVVRAVLKEIGLAHLKIDLYPWARAYLLAQKEPNVLIYSIARTAQRENLFKWVGEVCPWEVYLYKLKERKDIELKTLEDAKKYTVGVVRDDARAQFLVNNGFIEHQNLAVKAANSTAIKLLFMRREIDLIPMDAPSLAYNLRQLFNASKQTNSVTLSKIAFSMSKIERSIFLFDSQLYMAFSKQTDDAIVNKFRDGLKKIKAKGIFDSIFSKWTE